jgi:hypothetical protein
MAIGEAAGAAAAICSKDNVNPRNVDVEKLQDILIKQNSELRK